MKKGIVIRIVLTVLTFMLFVLINNAINIAAPIASGELAVKQLEDSNTSYFVSQLGIRYLSNPTMSVLILFVLFVAIWWKPAKEYWKKIGTVVAIIACLLFAVPSAQAYYDTKDRPEYVEIGPNQSAFLIPLQGANKSSQGKFMSVEYLSENKVATKRIQIPHTLIHMPGLERDQYVPAAKLIIVDRTPFQREWVAASDKGTSTKNEGFEFESNESINVSSSVVIAAFVKEEDAAKFLYWFGVKNAANPNDNESNFASVSYGYSLTEVMDTYVRGMVQMVLAREFGSRTLIDAIAHKAEIMKVVEFEVKKAFAENGITIKYIGFSASLTFDEKIQQQINQVFIANTDVKRYDALSKMLPLKSQEADIAIKNGTANAIQKWDGKIPYFFLIPDKIIDSISEWFGRNTVTSAPVKHKK